MAAERNVVDLTAVEAARWREAAQTALRDGRLADRLSNIIDALELLAAICDDTTTCRTLGRSLAIVGYLLAGLNNGVDIAHGDILLATRDRSSTASNTQALSLTEIRVHLLMLKFARADMDLIAGGGPRRPRLLNALGHAGGRINSDGRRRDASSRSQAWDD